MRSAAAWLILSMLLCLAARGAVAAERPNVLIAISDDQSFPHASAYGSRLVKTPAFDRVAREGVLFTRAYVASPGCSPSRAALLTGRHTWQLEQAGTHASSFPSKYRVLPELLEGAGYHVGYTGKGWGPGNWKKSGRARNPAGPSYGRRKQKPPHKGISGNDYASNFADFLAAREDNRPFCFWYGASEPHRGYEAGAGRKVGKKLADADVPSFLPDHEAIRGDLLDYGVEIEWFDRHLARMLAQLDEAGQLDNTIVIVTGDNGMPFPRAKANCYEYGIHVPLAIRWPARVPGGRTSDDLVSLIDLAPTLLEAAGVSFPADAPPMSGRSLLALLAGGRSGTIEPDRVALAARERHSCSRYENKTYPQRALRSGRYLYIRNFAPQRWPAGAPRKYGRGDQLGPPHAAYHDIDACPSLSLLVEGRDDPAIGRFLHLAVDRRPAEELFDVEADPGCLRNLTDDPAHADARRRLAARLEKILRDTGDPRLGENGDIWESYPRLTGPMRKFPPPTDDKAGAAGRRGANSSPPFAPESFAYVLQAEGLGKRSAAVEQLARCDRDLLVIDYAFYGDAGSKWTPAEVDRIRAGKQGRPVVAYLSIGEAGTYRFYWNKSWDADADGRPDPGAPHWLLPANPDWPDNYKVRYWDADWQRLVVQHLDEILAQGFDGVYLDLVDAFEFFEHDAANDTWIDHRPNPQTGNTYRHDMARWVGKVAAHARRTRPGFLVIPQNGLQLLEETSYLETIDAVGVEDLFTHGNRIQSAKETEHRSSFLKHAAKANRPILLIEYCRSKKPRRHAIAGAANRGWQLLVTDRALKTLGECPTLDAP